MIILTDRAETQSISWDDFGRANKFVVVDLEKAFSVYSENEFIVLDADLSNPVKANRVGEALRHLQPALETPIVYLARDPNSVSLARARSLGATSSLPSNVPASKLVAIIEELSEQSKSNSAKRRAGRAVELKIAEAGQLFNDIFVAARNRQPISAQALEQGSDIVLSTLKQSKVRIWLDIVSTHDDLTFQHCLLVAGLVAAFSVKLCLSLRNQRLLTQGALLHDIGKALIPPSILNKQGRLSQREFTIIKTHPVSGYEMLERQRGIDPAMLDIVRHHHEYIDGTGYPDGLKSNQIAYFVRLVTICDIYAALIERRPYRAAMPSAQAFTILTDMGGKIDGGLLSIFRDLISED